MAQMMPEPEQTLRTGGCLCGAVRYGITAPVDHLDVCHCAMCRKHSGGIATTVAVQPDQIDWTGTDHIGVYSSSEWAERGFCKTCGSSLFWRMTAEGPAQGYLSLSAGTLDDLTGLPLKTEIYIDHKPGGYAFAGDTMKMTQAEVEAAFAGEEGESA